MTRERQALEVALDAPVHRCRQHWLRFSWAETWAAQELAGLGLDTTLGFNDAPGFRNGCALRFHPWDPTAGQGRPLEAIPLMLMDSHLYDYALLSESDRDQVLGNWLDELKQVRGIASVVWHQQAFHSDYGWAGGYARLLSRWTGIPVPSAKVAEASAVEY
jgi:hypothetical protein